MFTTNWWISQPLPLGVPRYRPPNTAGRSGPRRPGGGRRDAADDGAERRPGRTAPAAAAKAGGGHGRPTPGATGRFGATGLETCNARTSGEDSYIIHTYIYKETKSVILLCIYICGIIPCNNQFNQQLNVQYVNWVLN